MKNIVLKILDIHGGEIVTLVNKIQSPGEYTVPLNAFGLPAGIYLVLIQVGDAVATEKMVVMR